VRRLLLAAAALAAATLAIVGCGPEAPTLVRRPATPPPALLIRHVGVLDVAAGQRVPDRDVLVRGGRIAAIGLGGDLPAPADAREIDGGGATLLPGLIDVHGHVGLDSGPSWERALPDVEANLRAYLYAGVTTLLDPGDGSPDAVERRDRIARGELLGPTIFTAGKLVTSPGGHPIPLLEASLPFWLRWFVIPGAVDTAGTPAEARSIAAARADEGVDFLKLIVDRIPLDAPRMDVETLDAAVEEAHARGLRAIAHIGDVRDALDTGHAGIDAWMHAVYKERIPDALVGELAGFGIPMVPTLTVWHSYAALGRGPRTSTRLERETVPADVLAAFDSPPEDSAISGVFRPYLDALDARRAVWGENVRKLHAAGVVMLAGSDTQSGVFPGAGLHREIGYLHAAGLSPAEAIRAATLAPARFLAGRDDPDFGEVAVGKRADLLLVRGDPLADLDALADVREVILRGVPLERTPIGARPARP
jgi:imidazolonepropionase-like amidohydrolase